MPGWANVHEGIRPTMEWLNYKKRTGPQNSQGIRFPISEICLKLIVGACENDVGDAEEACNSPGTSDHKHNPHNHNATIKRSTQKH